MALDHKPTWENDLHECKTFLLQTMAKYAEALEGIKKLEESNVSYRNSFREEQTKRMSVEESIKRFEKANKDHNKRLAADTYQRNTNDI